MADGVSLGFYGKLPSHGDFVRRRVSAGFLGVWDPWLQATLEASRRAMREQWLATYLTSPLWRFVLTPGVCDGQTYAGVLMPSVDAVGRYFPLTLTAELPAEVLPLNLVVEQDPWFERAEQLALSVLNNEADFDLGAFDQSVEALGRELLPRLAEDGVGPPDGRPVCYGLAGLGEISASIQSVSAACIGERIGAYSLWWTEGSERVSPCWCVCPGLPQSSLFTAALDGEWTARGWAYQPGRYSAPNGHAPSAGPSTPPRLRSSGVTNAGAVREANEDALVELPHLGIWAVADGVGGQEAGATASRMVVDALRRIDGNGDLQDRLNQARNRLAAVNGHLRHIATRAVAPQNSASTVAALLTGEAGCAYLWAGDSRIYRLRRGKLTQCTRDHSLVEGLVQDGSLAREDARQHPKANVITRAIGAADALEVEVGFGDLMPGDRFLLCSDGVHGVATDGEIAEVLAEGDAAEVTRRVLELALSRGAPDNVTAVVVDVITDALAGEGW
ncbi:type VI secretion system-associated protein TagF [Arhodomonas sp. SL1]|uniref:type VI secretion system-associated protein TagF n=1 Tax=Arhodomonas sp. SL1 TaxID=3425691 RepID=UPI003F880F4C